MLKKAAALFVVTLCAAAAVGCSSGADLQARVDELTREQEELQRQKEAAESDALAYRTKCEALERKSRRDPEPAPAVSPIPADPVGLDIRKRGNDTVINIPSDVFFASGSATLSPGGEKSMGKIADYIRKNQNGGMIRVEGHSDSDPIRRTKGKFHCNWDLSFQRAHAVMHFLVDKGQVDPHQLVCEAYGEYQPQNPGDKSKNRRVEIVLAR
ncbi:MAG TPA: flagellar motor protein MotB [Planctomycetota bacterium]|nr:flagellar motor protein MotB [Planctomycetota bacterium]